MVGRALNATVARAPWLWPVIRGPIRNFFDDAAIDWDGPDGSRSLARVETLATAVTRIDTQPERILDLGTGTGDGALFLAREYPRASVRGVDLSEEMVRRAQKKIGLDPDGRVAFRTADAADLPFEDDSFDLVSQVNVPPFFRRDRPRPSPRRQRDRRRKPRRGNPLLHAAHGPRPRLRPARHPAGGHGRGRRWDVLDGPGFAVVSGTPDLVLIVNPRAGGGRARKLLAEAERAIASRGLRHRVVLTESIEHGRRETVAAVDAGAIPVVVSGDGLIGQAGGAIAGRGATMGVIPGGRGNDFARVAGIPTDVGQAVDALAAGRTREIDVGAIDGARFLCIASCGFDSDANRIANEAKFVRGNLVYAYAAIKALVEWRPATFRLEFNGQVREVRGYSVAAANGAAYGGGMYAAPAAELDDGLLEVVSCAEMGKLRFLFRLIPKSFKGTHVGEPEVNVDRAAEVRISADRPFVVYADGDPIAALPVTIRLLPKALRIIIPAG